MRGLVAVVVLLGLVQLGACQTRQESRAENPCTRRGGTSAHESYCDKFYECVGDDEVVVRDCPNGLVYAGRKSLIDVCGYDHEYECEAGMTRSAGQRLRGAAPSEQLDPCQERRGIAAHKDYCDRYLECSNDQVYEVDCPNGLVFSERGSALLDNCGYPTQNPYACLDKELANPPISTENCDWLYGIFGHETSCTRYWTCWNGTSTQQYCIGGLLFNEKTHSCDWPEFVANCQKHPLCAEDANGNVPLGKSCERYWSCQGGYPRLMRCPATLVFDKVSRRCVHPPTEDCDVPPTESPEELGELQPEQQQQTTQQGGRRPQPQRQQQQPQPQQQQQQSLQPLDDQVYYDDDEFDPGFSSAPVQQEAAPQPNRVASLSRPRPNFRSSAPRPPLRGPAIPAGAIPIN